MAATIVFGKRVRVAAKYVRDLRGTNQFRKSYFYCVKIDGAGKATGYHTTAKTRDEALGLILQGSNDTVISGKAALFN